MRHLPVALDIEAIAALCEEFHVVELSLFGSVLRDDFGPDSNVDVLVVFALDAPVGLFGLAALQRKLAELFARPVDIGEKDSLKRLIRDEVISSSRLVYAAA